MRKNITDAGRIDFIERSNGVELKQYEETGEFIVFTYESQWQDGDTVREAIDKAMAFEKGRNTDKRINLFQRYCEYCEAELHPCHRKGRYYRCPECHAVVEGIFEVFTFDDKGYRIDAEGNRV